MHNTSGGDSGKRIEDYGLLSDCHGSALVSAAGNIEWLALPRFDSNAMFSSLIGHEEHGIWTLESQTPLLATSRSYRPDTMILQTTFRSAEGIWQLTDAMIMDAGYHRHLVRRVRGVSGTPHLRSRFIPRFDYGRALPWMRHENGDIIAMSGPDACILRSSTAWRRLEHTWEADFTLAEDQVLDFTLTWYPSHLPAPDPLDVTAEIEKTARWWSSWARSCTYAGPYRDTVVRSLLTLKALTYEPTGACIAAPTTSLPECIGGVRNWDYRYCWLRDATFTVLALLNAGFRDEAEQFSQWLLRAIAGRPSDMQILYSVSGERRIEEWEADHLPGFAGSKPVRIGNAAYTQEQFDVYGEVFDALFVALRHDIPMHASFAEMLESIVGYVRRRCLGQPDRGMWEIRGEPQIMVQSQVMVWVVLDRALQLQAQGFLKGDAEAWRVERDALHAEICRRGFNEELGSFVQHYGSKAVDANLMLLPFVGFLPIDDPRITATVERIERELLVFPFVKRYSTEGDPGADGLPPGEGAFLACSYWLCDIYAMQGKREKAQQLFEALIAHTNDLGLLSEEFDVTEKRFLGNFPQAFSHLGLVNSAHNLEKAYGPARQRSARHGPDGVI